MRLPCIVRHSRSTATEPCYNCQRSAVPCAQNEVHTNATAGFCILKDVEAADPGLDINGYDRAKCQKEFDQYKSCKEKEV